MSSGLRQKPDAPMNFIIPERSSSDSSIATCGLSSVAANCPASFLYLSYCLSLLSTTCHHFMKNPSLNRPLYTPSHIFSAYIVEKTMHADALDDFYSPVVLLYFLIIPRFVTLSNNFVTTLSYFCH